MILLVKMYLFFISIANMKNKNNAFELPVHKNMLKNYEIDIRAKFYRDFACWF